jgi:hypothetical protein
MVNHTPFDRNRANDPVLRALVDEVHSLSAKVEKPIVRKRIPAPTTVDQILTHPHPLELLRATLRQGGIVGNLDAAVLGFLTILSRKLNDPLSVMVLGNSAAGKSYPLNQVGNLFHKSALIVRSAVSPKALIYTPAKFEHATLFLQELKAILDESALNVIKGIASEHRILYEVTDSEIDEHGNRGTHLIEKNGPTALLLTTAKNALDPELKTRLLLIWVDTGVDQWKRIGMSIGRDGEAMEPIAMNVDPWLEATSIIHDLEVARIRVGFMSTVASLANPVHDRYNRDIKQVRSAIQVHALLCHRQRDIHDGVIEATVEDYEAVRPLLLATMHEAVRQASPQHAIDVMQAIAELQLARADVTVKALADKCGVSRPTMYSWLEPLIDKGHVIKLDHQAGYDIDRALPAMQDVLPSARRVTRALILKAKAGSL